MDFFLAHKYFLVGSLVSFFAGHLGAVDHLISIFLVLQAKYGAKAGLGAEELTKVQSLEATAAQKIADDLNKPA